MTPRNFNLPDAHKLYDDALQRGHRDGPRRTMGTVVQLAREGGYGVPFAALNGSFGTRKQLFDSVAARPKFNGGGMPPRTFAGPSVENGTRLFPRQALSGLVALGGVGKTTLALSTACHVAAGRSWNGSPVEQCKVIIFCVEETKDELDRKFSAHVVNWAPAERCAAEENLLLVSCLDIDARLTRNEKGHYTGTGVAEAMIDLAQGFGATLIFIDHVQGFVSGDLNVSETATAVAREANKIVAATGAAVVLTAHVSKANIKAQGIEQGLASGSLALENAWRQLVGVIPMPDEDAKLYGLEQTRGDYMRLAIPKNSYGPRDAGMWLRRVYSPSYHTVTIEPVNLAPPISMPRKSASDALCDKVVEYLKRHPMTTSNQLDTASGLDGCFKVSKEKVRAARSALVDSGRVILREVTPEERKAHNLGQQVKHVYEAVE